MAYFKTEYGNIYYKLYGQEGDTVVFLNGMGMSTSGWSPFIKKLTDRYRVLLVDLLDQGKTKSNFDEYNVEDQSDVLIRLLENLNIEKIHLAGMSYGGKVALTFAIDNMDKLISLGLINTDYRNSNHSMIRSKGWLKAAETLDGELFASVILTDMYSASYYQNNFDDMKKKEKFFIKNLNEEYLKRFRRSMESLKNFDVEGKLSQIKLPTIIISSDQDYVMPMQMQRKMHENIENSKWTIIEDSGHAVMYEKPEEFIKTYIGFLKDI